MNHFWSDISSAETTAPEHVANFVLLYRLDPDAMAFPLFVEGVEITTIGDNGVNVTVISKCLADFLHDIGKATTHVAQETITVLDGAQVTLPGKMYLNIGTAKHKAKVDTWVSREVPFDLCVGSSFIRQNKFVVNFEDGLITTFGEEHGETAVTMNNTEILSKLSQLAQVTQMWGFCLALTLSVAQ